MAPSVTNNPLGIPFGGGILGLPIGVGMRRAGKRPFQIVEYSADPSLKGFIYLPLKDGPYPIVVYIHGNAPKPGGKPGLASFFNENGYAFFVPHRRGHGISAGADPARPEAPPEAGAPQNAPAKPHGDMESAVGDVATAIGFIRRTDGIDGTKVFMMGGGFGGIVTLLACERDLGVKAALDFAGAARSWDNKNLQDRLKKAVDNSKVPIFFLQVQNDYSVEPTKVLSAEMAANNVNHQPCESKIYPSFGSSRKEGNAGFFENTLIWGTDVLAFLGRYGGSAPK